MKFGDDPRLGVNCNCNIFPVNQYKGLLKKSTQQENNKIKSSLSLSSNKQFEQNNKINKQKISLRKGSLNMNKDKDLLQGFQSRKISTPKSQSKNKGNRDFSSNKNNNAIIYYGYGYEKNKNINNCNNLNNGNVDRFAYSSLKPYNCNSIFNRQNNQPLAQKNIQSFKMNNYQDQTYQQRQQQQNRNKFEKNSLSPHFKTASNFKNYKLQAESKNSLVKKYPLKQLISYKQNRSNNQDGQVQRLLFQNVQLKTDKKLNQKEQKCSFTTMAGSNTGFSAFHGPKTNFVSQSKPQIALESYMLCSQHESQYYIDRTAQGNKCRLPNSYSLNDLLYKNTQSLLGQGQNIDDSQFSEVINSNKRIQGLQLINNLKNVNPFFRVDNDREIVTELDINQNNDKKDIV